MSEKTFVTADKIRQQIEEKRLAKKDQAYKEALMMIEFINYKLLKHNGSTSFSVTDRINVLGKHLRPHWPSSEELQNMIRDNYEQNGFTFWAGLKERSVHGGFGKERFWHFEVKMKEEEE